MMEVVGATANHGADVGGKRSLPARLAGAVEYTNCISAEG